MRHLALRDLFPALIKAELHRVFTIKLEINTLFTPKATHSININDTVVSKIFINFWIYDAISPHMENNNIRCHIRFVQSGTNIMVKMFKCCTTKEATTAVNIVKSTFQVFNVYLFGDVYLLSPKKTIILLPLLVFLFKTWFKRQVRTKIIRATGEEYFWGIVWWICRWYYNCCRDCILVKRISPFFDGLLKIFPSFSRTSNLH